IVPGSLPNNLTNLKLHYDYNFPFLKGIFPQSLKNLVIGNYKNEIQAEILPSKLESLTLLGYYKFPINSRTFPNTLKELSISLPSESIEIDSIPETLTELTLDEYSHPITPGLLPSSITSLDLGNYHLKLIPGAFPSSLESFTFCPQYNIVIPPGLLPTSLQLVIFGDKFNQVFLPDSLPNSITFIQLGYNYQQKIPPGVLPTSLSTMRVDCVYPLKMDDPDLVYPKGLRRIIINSEENITYMIPSTIEYLRIGSQHATFDYQLPDTLTELVLPDHFKTPLIGSMLPSSLKRLTLGKPSKEFTEDLSLSEKLTHLKIYSLKHYLILEEAYASSFHLVVHKEIPLGVIMALTQAKRRLKSLSIKVTIPKYHHRRPLNLKSYIVESVAIAFPLVEIIRIGLEVDDDKQSTIYFKMVDQVNGIEVIRQHQNRYQLSNDDRLSFHSMRFGYNKV
ncbi:hypothetical protein SAMD00019534_066950, partial [Acytostelium subglobosum LB1]|uniref:hypothetical protein n=1 Tax=Acytostelium subglobosum LB1 TaxID=1410327 RepID=UPI00064521DD